MQDNVADGLAAVASHPVTVQVINQGPGIWGNVATGLITAGAAIAAVILTHQFTLRREKQVSEEKLNRERQFIATELIFLLEQFAEGCAAVATDEGFVNKDGLTVPSTSEPDIDFSSVSGDWRVLPGKLIYRIRELPVLKAETVRTIQNVDAFPPEFDEFFAERQTQYTRLGLKAIIQARRLRRFAGLPETRLDATPWSAQHVLWKEWKQEQKRRRTQAQLTARLTQMQDE
ncbi:hypothetical protein ACUY4Q_005039 (plasmid) [Phytobacter sp. AG2a]